jgi:hypothetical protein
MTSYASQAGRADGTSEWNQLDFAVRSIMNRMATATIVQVKAVSGATVDVQPMVHQLDGAANAVPHGIIHGVPVWRAQGGGSAVILDPQVGDVGLAIFAHSDVSSVKANAAPSPPGSLRRFSWADAIYLGGLLNQTPTRWLRFAPDGAIELAGDDTITIRTSGSIRLSTDIVSASGTIAADKIVPMNGVSTTAVDKNGKVLTFTNGILTGVSA